MDPEISLYSSPLYKTRILITYNKNDNSTQSLEQKNRKVITEEDEVFKEETIIIYKLQFLIRFIFQHTRKNKNSRNYSTPQEDPSNFLKFQRGL